MTIRRSLYLSAAAVALLALGGLSTKTVTAERLDAVVDDRDDASDDGDSDDPALDDGKALLSKAKLTFDEAKAAAQKANPGAVEEIDLEYWDEKLVFDVDMGAKTVKVDAMDGTVLAIDDKDPVQDND